jgi:hypothetical protein
MKAYDKYMLWLRSSYFDEDTKKELEEIRNNKEEIEERFYKDLEFGTGGLRGIIGAGTNRMNKYTVRKASQGVANYINKSFSGDKKIVIAYDSRHYSYDFAMEAAGVFAGNGIKAYVFEELRPTPELSFAVRFLKASAGIVITASHNPKQYNGYKVYGEDGGQLPPKSAEEVLNEINALKDITNVSLMGKDEAVEKGLIEIIGTEMDDAYIKIPHKNIRYNAKLFCIQCTAVCTYYNIGFIYVPGIIGIVLHAAVAYYKRIHRGLPFPFKISFFKGILPEFPDYFCRIRRSENSGARNDNVCTGFSNCIDVCFINPAIHLNIRIKSL